MPVGSIIDRFATQRVASVVFYDATAFSAAPDSKKVIFITHLWSVESQVALFELCTSLNKAPDPLPAVLVLDGDVEMPADIPKCDELLTKGVGVIILLRDDVVYEALSGSEFAKRPDTLSSFLFAG